MDGAPDCHVNRLPEQLIMFCGSDCSQCDKYARFLAGDESGLVNLENNNYRCCWLPKDYPRGRTAQFGRVVRREGHCSAANASSSKHAPRCKSSTHSLATIH